MDPHPEPRSAIQAELDTIRVWSARAKIARTLLTICIIDVLLVGCSNFDVRGGSVVHMFLGVFGPHYCASSELTRYYQTPEGVRIVSDYSEERERIESECGAFPPPDWKDFAWIASPHPRHHSPVGAGIITPFVRTLEYRFLAADSVTGAVLPETSWRDMYCDWLALEYANSPEAIAFAAELRKGDHRRSRLSWPLLAHDIAVLCVAGWSIITFTSAPARARRKSRRIRRGLCPYCSYDLLSDFSRGCSECGWGREP